MKKPKKVIPASQNKVVPKSNEHQHPSESIGHELTEQVNGKGQRHGTAISWEYTGSTIRNMKTGKTWPAFHYRMRGKQGAEWWSRNYPDKSPKSKTLPELLEAFTAINTSRAHAASWAGELGDYIETVKRMIVAEQIRIRAES